MDDRLALTALAAGLRPVLALAALAVATLAACATSGSGSPSDEASASPASPTPLEGTPWQLTESAGLEGDVGPGGEIHPVPEGIVVTALFADGRVSGNSGCNRYTGAYAVDGDALTVTDIATTMMACEPARMALEQAFTAALTNTAIYSITGATLELGTADGALSLRFAATPSPSLIGTEWIATMINNGKGGVVSVVAGTTVSAVFGPDGRVAGSGGCNRYSGTYTADGSSLAVGPVAATKMACPAPGVMEQEGQYYGALTRVTTYTFDGDRLQLRDASGALQVDYRAVPSP